MSFVHACPGYAFGLADRFTLQVLRQAIGTVLSSFVFFQQTSVKEMLSPLRLAGSGHRCSAEAIALAAGQHGPTNAGQLVGHRYDENIPRRSHF